MPAGQNTSTDNAAVAGSIPASPTTKVQAGRLCADADAGGGGGDGADPVEQDREVAERQPGDGDGRNAGRLRSRGRRGQRSGCVATVDAVPLGNGVAQPPLGRKPLNTSGLLCSRGSLGRRHPPATPLRPRYRELVTAWLAAVAAVGVAYEIYTARDGKRALIRGARGGRSDAGLQAQALLGFEWVDCSS